MHGPLQATFLLYEYFPSIYEYFIYFITYYYSIFIIIYIIIIILFIYEYFMSIFFYMIAWDQSRCGVVKRGSNIFAERGRKIK